MDRTVVPGALLVSVPQMLDPNFMHTVVLMVEHGEGGALGLVVNQLTELRLGDLVEGHPLLDGFDFPVHSGGPVGRDSLQFVHRLPHVIGGGVDLDDGLALGGRLEDLAEGLASGDASPENLRFFVGYSGWGVGQLEAEFDTGSWVPAPPSADLCFAEEQGEPVWRQVLQGLGDAGQALAQLPPDVTWN
jgi:putative transcriptional regulator